MNSRIPLSLVLVSMLICMPMRIAAQGSSETVRKVVTRVTPQYPSLARSTNIKGNVRMLVVVDPNGSPKSIEIKGGNPVLAQSAEKAVRDWRWEPSSRVTSEVIDLRFDPR
jgi:TonB family protein